MEKGIFWFIDDKLLCFKSDTFNHRRVWADLPRQTAGGFLFNHYPRGRVELKHDKAVIYLNPNICTEPVIEAIKQEFGLSCATVEVKVDGSKHYRCYLDDCEE